MRFIQCAWHKRYTKQKIRAVYRCHLRRLNKCSVVAEMGDRLVTIDIGQKLKGAVPVLGGGAGSSCNTMRPEARPILCTKWHLDPSRRLATTNMGRNLGGCVPCVVELGPHLTQCCAGRDLPSYQVAFWSIQPFGHNKLSRKLGAVPAPFGKRAESPSNIMWPEPRPTYIPSGILIRAAVWPQ